MKINASVFLVRLVLNGVYLFRAKRGSHSGLGRDPIASWYIVANLSRQV